MARKGRLVGLALPLTAAVAWTGRAAWPGRAVPPLIPGTHFAALGGRPVAWIGESLFLLVMAAYVAAFLALTTRRLRMAPTTLAAGTAAGIVFGVILYALVPLGIGVGALVASVLGTGTIALMPRVGWLLGWLYPGQHLLAATAHHRALAASADAAGYLAVLLILPILGLGLGLAAGDTEKPPLALVGDGLPGSAPR